MAAKENDKTFYMKLLIVACIFFAILSVSVFNNMRSIDTKYKKEKSAFIKEKMAIKDELDSLKSELKAKDDAVESLEAERKAIADELSQVKKSIVELENKTSLEKEAMAKTIEDAKKASNPFSGYTTAQMIKEISAHENNENVKKFLSEVVSKIDMIMEGKVVALDPIVVTTADENKETKAREEVVSKILSVDRDTGLVIINIGRDHNLHEDQKIIIYNENDEPICSATVIKLRFKVSAAVIDSFEKKHSIRDVKEGFRVTKD